MSNEIFLPEEEAPLDLDELEGSIEVDDIIYDDNNETLR